MCAPLLRLGSITASLLSIILAAFVYWLVPGSNAADSSGARSPLFRTVELDVNEVQEVGLADGTRVRVKLVSINETRDALRDAVREARVQVELNGQPLVLTSATYHLPVTFGGIQIDCPLPGVMSRTVARGTPGGC